MVVAVVVVQGMGGKGRGEGLSACAGDAQWRHVEASRQAGKQAGKQASPTKPPAQDTPVQGVLSHSPWAYKPPARPVLPLHCQPVPGALRATAVMLKPKFVLMPFFTFVK